MQIFLKYVHGSLDLIPKTPHKVYGIKFFVVKLDHNAPVIVTRSYNSPNKMCAIVNI